MERVVNIPMRPNAFHDGTPLMFLSATTSHFLLLDLPRRLRLTGRIRYDSMPFLVSSG